MLWLAALIANLGMWMQNVSAAWLMTTLTDSPIMVALIQTAAVLPIFLFGLPGGVLADLADRRRLLLAGQFWLCVVAIALSIVSYGGWIGPWPLIILTFALGTGYALQVAAWQATASDVVPRDMETAAVTLNSVAFNVGRAAGPAIAGAVIASFGSSAVFLLDVFCFSSVIGMLWRWRPAPRLHAVREIPHEDLLGGMRTAMRYVRHSPHLRIEMLRTAILITNASGLWALLPLVARHQLGSGATGYGLLLGSLGFGAVVGALVLLRLRSRFGLGAMISGGSAVFAVATLSAAFVNQIAVLCTAMVAGGAAWVAISSTIHTVVQTSVPSWVRARAVAIFILIFQGSMALGSIIWGFAASRVGVPYALCLSVLTMICGLVYTRRHALQVAGEAHTTASPALAHPEVACEPDPEDGPVAVQIRYRIQPSERTAFLFAVHEAGLARQRNGGTGWHLYRDLADQERYMESFVVASWADYLRQRSRATVADRQVESTVAAFQKDNAAIEVTRYLSEDPPAR